MYCDPNCATKIIPFSMDEAGKDAASNNNNTNSILKRVVIVAQRDIEPMEELTYDYQFPLEVNMNERIPCNCGSELCRGFMNWDLPEKGAKNLRVEKKHTTSEFSAPVGRKSTPNRVKNMTKWCLKNA